jgi:hypothetical protein
MTTSTESIKLIQYAASNNLTEIPPEKNEWYDRVYLCWEDRKLNQNTLPIRGFYCYRFNSFTDADNSWNCYYKKQKNDRIVTMIPMCKWVPEIFDKFIINWKLKKQFWLGKNIFRRGSK